METKRGGDFFRSIRKEVAGVMAGLAGFGAAAEAGAKERGVPEKAEDAFEEVEQETAGATAADVEKGVDRFQTRLVMAVGAEKAKGIMATLNKELQRDELSPDQQLEIVDLYSDRLEKLLAPKEQPKEETRFEKIEKKSEASQTELSENAFGFGNFFDESVSSEDAIKTLDVLLQKGTSSEYNGVTFVKDRDGNLFCNGKPVTAESRTDIIRAYKAVREKLISEGVTLH